MSEKRPATPRLLRDGVSITNELDQLRRQPGFYKSAEYLIRQQLEAHTAHAVATERERIVKELVEANLLESATPKPRRSVFDKTSVPSGYGECLTCGWRADECVCIDNAILRIVNPDAETGT